MVSVLPDPATPFGRRVRDRFRDEEVIWLTTVGRDGTPQPNPVWFSWPSEEEILTYNMPAAHRLAHIAERPAVSLHFNSAEDGNDVVVARGIAERADDEPPPHASSRVSSSAAPTRARACRSTARKRLTIACAALRDRTARPGPRSRT